MLYVLDLIGTFAFAVYGAHLARRKSFDIFGIAACAGISALGGGTIGDLLLNRLPPYFSDGWYAAVILAGIAFAVVTFSYFESVHPWILVLDAIGLVTFAFLGADRAAQAGLGTLGIALFAVLTAVGGGVLRDVAVKEIPLIFYRDFYATPALLLGLAYAVFRPYMHQAFPVNALLMAALLLRLLAIRYNLSLWKPGSPPKPIL